MAHVNNSTKSGWWKGENKICYNLFMKIFEARGCVHGNQRLLVLDQNIILPKCIRFMKKNPCSGCSVILELYSETGIN
jgi:hypothetical protein